MSPGQWLLLAFLSLIWGGTFLFNAVSVKELPPITIVLARVFIGGALLIPVTYALGAGLPRSTARWRDYTVMALLNNVIPFTLIVWSQQYITSGLASVLNATTPMWSVVLAHAFATEPLTKSRLAGVSIGVAGVAVLIGPDALGGNRDAAIGMACSLVATLCYGLSSVWARRFKGVPPTASAAAQLICSTVLLLPAALLIDRPWLLALPSTPALLSLIGLGALGTALAYVIIFHIMTVSGPSNAMLVTLLIPVSAVVIGHLVLDEPALARHIAGGLVIAAALVLIDGRLPRALGVWIRPKKRLP